MAWGANIDEIILKRYWIVSVANRHIDYIL